MRKIQCSFFPKENLICPHHIFPHYTHILFIHYILLSKEMLPIPKITSQMQKKNALQFLKNFPSSGLKALLHSAYLLWSEFQRIIWMLIMRQEFMKSRKSMINSPTYTSVLPVQYIKVAVRSTRPDIRKVLYETTNDVTWKRNFIKSVKTFS